MPCPYFGNYPAEYNRVVHGPYDPAVYYGKRDTALAEVKIGELPKWLARRNYWPNAMAGCVSRAYWRWAHKFYHPKYATPLRPLLQMCTLLSIAFTINVYPHAKEHRRYKYHW